MLLLALIACTAEPGTKDPSATGEDDSGTTDPTGTTPEGPPVDAALDADHVLVVSSMNTITALDADGGEVRSWAVDDFVDSSTCSGGQCRAEGVTPDGDGLVVNWALQERTTEGGLLRLDPVEGDLEATWVQEGWSYPHEVRRDPGSSTYIVADAFLDSVSWVPDDGSGDPDHPLTEIGSNDSNQYGAHVPNGLALASEGDVVGLLICYRGNDASNPGAETGRLAMWDIADADAPRLLWVFPASGNLQAPHDPSLHWRDGRWLLLYAQSHGDANTAGTVGVAELADLTTQPTYLADLRPASGSWGYPRGALLTGDDTLFVTDTPGLGGGGGGSGEPGAVYRMAFPTDLAATGKGGAYSSGGSDQAFEDLADVETFAEGFDQTYRSFVWKPTW